MTQHTRGAIAAGHPQTVEAGLEMLHMGGNAFDAAIAAMLASLVAEPALTSLAGGGFLLAHTADQRNVLYDFFTQTPRQKRSPQDLDFHAVDVNFGTATQQFHVGMGSIAVPGTLAGICHVHDQLGRLPFEDVMAPAIYLARTGAMVNQFQAYCASILSPILLKSDEMRSVVAPGGVLLPPGSRMVMPALADTLSYLAVEGDRAFYEGDIGERLVHDCQTQGGHLTMEDLRHYQVIERQPLMANYRGRTFLSNPPPSSGGALIAFTLQLLSRIDLAATGFGSPHHVKTLAEAMRLTNQARKDGYDHCLHEDSVLEKFLSEAHLEPYHQQLEAALNADALNKWGSTTHISAIDGEGNAASVTASNGEGSSYVIPGTGIMTNNMLGEADLHPGGFHQWQENTRISSMMAPTIVLQDGKPQIVLGSGGSNRIRTAILQVISNLLDFQMPIDAAVNAPRIHWEAGVMNLEPGFDQIDPSNSQDFPFDGTVIQWQDQNMFFGGVHAVVKTADGAPTSGLNGAGDRRRGGAIAILP